jgi:tripartite ATP-independent transporter DctM subunit
MGAVGALLIAASKKRLNFGLLKQTVDSTTKLSCFVLFILIGSTVFSLTFRAVEGDLWVEHLMGDLPGGELGFLIAVQILIFVLGFFLDFFEIAFIVIPLLVPVADKLGIDLVWFGVMIAMNMQTSFLTPPFGFSLFYLKSVTPTVVKTLEIYKGSVPFIGLQLLMVVLIFVFPQLVSQEEKVKFKDSPLQLNLPASNYGSENESGKQQPFVPSFSE